MSPTVRVWSPDPVASRPYPRRRTTYAWAVNQPCDAMYRFDGAARILAAVKGDTALYSTVATDDEQRRREILSILGL